MAQQWQQNMNGHDLQWQTMNGDRWGFGRDGFVKPGDLPQPYPQPYAQPYPQPPALYTEPTPPYIDPGLPPD
jgi:hypothetical protein